MSRNYYIFKSGNIIRKNNSLSYIDMDGLKKDIPIMDIDDIYLFGKTTFNTDLLNFISDNSINLHIFDFYGNYKGIYQSNSKYKSGVVLIKQCRSYDDNRLYISKQILNSAKHGMLLNLKEYNISINDIDKINLNDSLSIESLMGNEGQIRKKYYSYFKNILKKYDFKQRIKNPPNNEVNSLISFGNVLCYSEVAKAICNTSLSPYISFLHEPTERRNSLSLDLAEIFKPIFIDRIIFKLINNNIINDKHFIKEENICYLNEIGKKIFVKEWDDKLKTTIYHKQLKRNVSYKDLIKYECYKLQKYIVEGGSYEPLKMWW